MQTNGMVQPTSPHSSKKRMVVFGTGVFLRAFVCDFAAKAGYGVAMVSSTTEGDGRAALLRTYGGAYHLALRGIGASGETVDTLETVDCIEAAFTAKDGWMDFLETAKDESYGIVVSNVTESAFKLLEQGDAAGIAEAAKGSFPAKLTAWLHTRWMAFSGKESAGVVVLPCELVAGNGEKLRGMVLHLADRWNCQAEFVHWLNFACDFADTLVDRIVAGTPPDSESAYWRGRIGHTDPLLTTAEPYTLWAIKGDAALAAKLAPLVNANGGAVVVAPSIEPYSLRKVRLLNGTHTCMALAATEYSGVETVLQAVQNSQLGEFLHELLWQEILPTVVPMLGESDAKQYAEQTWARFANPFLAHQLAAIRKGQMAKWTNRLVPTITLYTEQFGTPPKRILHCQAVLEQQKE